MRLPRLSTIALPDAAWVREIRRLMREVDQIDPAHGWSHAVMVFRHGRWLREVHGEVLEPDEWSALEAATLLHDLGHHANQIQGISGDHGELGAEMAGAILPVRIPHRERIIEAVRYHNKAIHNGDSLTRLLQDADKLEAFGVRGIYRTCSNPLDLPGQLMNIKYMIIPWIEDMTERKKPGSARCFFSDHALEKARSMASHQHDRVAELELLLRTETISA